MPRGSAALWGATVISWTSAKAAIFLHFEDAAAVADIGLDDGRGLALAQFAEAPAGGAALAGGDGDGGRARQFQQGADVVGGTGRLLDEERL